jgi:hypothetical protein
MSVQNVKFTNLFLHIFLTLTAIALAHSVSLFSQMPADRSSTTVETVQEFLRALYPDLIGKGYTLTVETSLKYDEPPAPLLSLYADIGAGPKHLMKECCLGGTVGGVIGVTTSPNAQKLPQADTIDWDSQGRGYPKQFLHTYFSFDKHQRLIGFTADGPAIDHTDATNKITELVNNQPNITDAEIAEALRKSGAKFGPNDKAKFAKSLPLKTLEQFLGKLEIISIDFPSIRTNQKSDGSWLFCSVEVVATQPNGEARKYKLTFDHFNGSLVSIQH